MLAKETIKPFLVRRSRKCRILRLTISGITIINPTEDLMDWVFQATDRMGRKIASVCCPTPREFPLNHSHFSQF
jgi:hypothetical protein